MANAMTHDDYGQVAEATGANTVFTDNGVIHTPMPACLAGSAAEVIPRPKSVIASL